MGMKGILMKTVYITDYINNPSIESQILQEHLSSDFHKNIEVLLVWNQIINKEYIDKLPKLKAIIRIGAGYDNVDVHYTKEKNIYVCNVPDYGVDEVSDTAIAMIMNIARGITRYDYLSHNFYDTWQENSIESIKRTSEYSLGVLGAGRIGSSVLLKAKALGFATSFYDPYLPWGQEKVLGSRRVEQLDEFLNSVDILSINCLLNEETKAMVDKEFIFKMKEGVSIVNTARGAIIKDLDIIYDALKSGHLSNIAFDVLSDEPPKESKLIQAWRDKEEWLDGRVIINPHKAYYSGTAYFEMRQKAALNAKRIIEGLNPINIVNYVN